MPTASVAERIKILNNLRSQLGLQLTEDDDFLAEWLENLPELEERERTGIDPLRQRYLYHRGDGPLLEGTVHFVVVSLLLELAGLLDPPFKVRSPESVAIEIEGAEISTCKAQP